MNDDLRDLSQVIGYLLALALLVVYVAALVNAAKTNKWLWFVGILISGFVAPVYMVVAYESPKKLHASERARRKTGQRRTAAKDRRIHELEQRVDELEAGPADDDESSS
jgi:hypothetical protein